MIVLGKSNFEFRFRSIIQYSHFLIHRPQCWKLDEKAEVEPKITLTKYDLSHIR